jgi:hypothetical protein
MYAAMYSKPKGIKSKAKLKPFRPEGFTSRILLNAKLNTRLIQQHRRESIKTSRFPHKPNYGCFEKNQNQTTVLPATTLFISLQPTKMFIAYQGFFRI